MNRKGPSLVGMFFFGLFLSGTLLCAPASAGNLDSPGAPSAGSGMPTLQGIYNQLQSGSTSAVSGSFQEPSSGPTAGTGKTLSDIQSVLPAPDNLNGASASDVLSGKTFWGLRTDGTWGLKTGAISSQGNVTGGNGSLIITIPDGYYSGKTATANDTNLVSGNIINGVSIFGVTGNIIQSTGTATAADVLTGSTFSNAAASGLTGSMPNNGAANFTPGRAAVPVPAGYYSGGQVNGDPQLSSCNIKPGQTIFGVTGKPYPAATGETGCWDASGGSIACAGTGQDGAYQYGCAPAVVPLSPYNRTYMGWSSAAGSGLTDKGNGTVTDIVTGLIWTKDGNCFGATTWSDAFTACNGLASGACGLSDGSVAGDWRLPNINELRSLVDLSQTPALPDGHPFTNLVDPAVDNYWSSTTYADYPVGQWSVYFFDGSVNNYDKGSLMYVWCVRGGQ